MLLVDIVYYYTRTTRVYVAPAPQHRNFQVEFEYFFFLFPSLRSFQVHVV
jgi:hypothetical protein